MIFCTLLWNMVQNSHIIWPQLTDVLVRFMPFLTSGFSAASMFDQQTAEQTWWHYTPKKHMSLWSSSVSAATTAKESADSLWELFDSETKLYPQCKHWCHCRGKKKQKTTSLMYLFQTWHMIHRSFTDIYLQGPCVVFIINKNKCAVWTIFSWGCGKKETNSPQNAEKLIFERTFFLLHMTNLDIVTCFSLTELY